MELFVVYIVVELDFVAGKQGAREQNHKAWIVEHKQKEQDACIYKASNVIAHFGTIGNYKITGL